MLSHKDGQDVLVEEDYTVSEHFSIAKTQEISNEYTISIDSEIVDSTKYQKIYKTLNEAFRTDRIIFQLSSPGGDCDTLIRLVNSIKACRAPVMMHVIGVCQSAAAMLALCGDSLYVFPNTYLMFHNYTSVDSGKGKELVDSVGRTDKWFREFYEQNCLPFLTRKELNKIFKDEDVTVHSSDKDLQDRLNRHFKRKN